MLIAAFVMSILALVGVVGIVGLLLWAGLNS